MGVEVEVAAVVPVYSGSCSRWLVFVLVGVVAVGVTVALAVAVA